MQEMTEDSLKQKTPTLFLRAMEEAKSFTDELMEENSSLRERLDQIAAIEKELQVQLDALPRSPEIEELARKREGLVEQIRNLEERQKKVATENADFNRRYVEVEDLNNRLANLYIASLRLHGSLHYEVVLKTAVEIVVNLVGAHDFAIYLADHRDQRLKMIASEGVLGGPLNAISLEEGYIGEAARTRRIYINEKGAGDPSDPLACIPLTIEGQLVGMIVIFSLLSQKKGKFNQADMEMFELLAAHAAAAIAASSIYAHAEDRLKTVEGYISVLRSSFTSPS